VREPTIEPREQFLPPGLVIDAAALFTPCDRLRSGRPARPAVRPFTKLPATRPSVQDP
jgi:hypothetical protein